jgi:large subunit ribosomal protein L10
MEKFGRACREYMVKELAERLKGYPNFFITRFSNIGVTEMERLRKSLKKDSSLYMVAKNAMLGEAIKKSGLQADMGDFGASAGGACGVLFTKADPVAISRLLVDFSKSHEALKIQAGFVNGEVISSDTVRFMSTLPGRDVLLSAASRGIKAPITRFVGVLRSLLSDFAGVVDAIGRKKSGVQNIHLNIGETQ